MRASFAGVLVLLSVVACGNDEPGAPAGSGVVATVQVTSPALHEGKPLRPPYACKADGDAGTSPPLSWRGAPAGTKAYAVTMIDTDADNFVHWGLLNLSARTRALRAGQQTPGTGGVIVVRNGFGDTGYGAPCPPAGAPHHYVTTVWALKRPARSLADLPDAALARGSVTVTYQR